METRAGISSLFSESNSSFSHCPGLQSRNEELQDIATFNRLGHTHARPACRGDVLVPFGLYLDLGFEGPDIQATG